MISPRILSIPLCLFFLFAGAFRAEGQYLRDWLLGRLDSIVPAKMQELHIPGVTVSIVKDSQVWLARGYGLADLESRRLVDGQTTGFRVASLSKLFTATAVMQLVEAGELDLHEDIRRYLGDLEIELEYDEPVTLHHLLTHTAGFDLSDIGDAAAEVADIYPLRQLVEEHQQPQVLPPGLAHHYSNFGFALAGYIVERVSGKPFPQYVDHHVFQPLGMKYSTFAQPPPDSILARLSRGYERKGGRDVPLPLDYSQVAPADALISTAEDMARFMLGHLGAEESLFDRETRRLMHRQQYAASPSPFGMAYGFEEQLNRGLRVLDHSGGQLGFASYLMLVPELNLGVFISQNRRGGDLRRTVAQLVLDAFTSGFSYPDLELEPVRTLDTEPYAGIYRHTGYTRHTFEKMAYVLGIAGRRVQIESDGPGALRINGDRFVLDENGQFTDARYGFVTTGFMKNEAGDVIYHTDGRDVYEKLRWWERKEWLQGTMMLSFLLAFWHATLWPWLVRRRVRQGRLDPEEDSRRWRRLVYTASGLWFMTFIFFYAITALAAERTVQFDYGVTWEMKVAMILLLLASACVLAIPLAAVQSWRRGWWSILSRLGLAFYSLTLLASIAIFWYANMLGFQY